MKLDTLPPQSGSPVEIFDAPASLSHSPSPHLEGRLTVESIRSVERQLKPNQTLQQDSRWASIGIFGSTFLTIFLAELGDKTQLATLLMSAESHNPWTVFAGAGAALITTSFLGVLVGRWLSTRLSPRTLDTAAGIILSIISALLFWEVFTGA